MGCSFSQPNAKDHIPATASTVARTSEKPKPASKATTYEAVGPEGYEEVQDLGTSHGGEYTKLLRNKKTKEIVAAKFVGTSAKEGVPRGIEREIVNHRSLTHPNIVRFYEVLIYDDTLGIVCEYPTGGCLSDSLAANGPVTEDQAKALFLQLLAGMQYCHAKKIWHRDLRVENILLDEGNGEPMIKIAGFGYSKSAVYDSDPTTKGMKAPLNTPPELLIGAGNQQAAYDGSKVDIWSSGIILFVMLTGYNPFEDPETPQVMSRAVMNRIVKCSYQFPPDIQLTNECKDFIRRILVAQPPSRPSIAQMLQMPWLTGVRIPGDSNRLVESKQSTTDIEDVIGRYRRRKENRYSNGNRYTGNSRPSNRSPHQSFPKRSASATINQIDGIAEYNSAEVKTAPADVHQERLRMSR